MAPMKRPAEQRRIDELGTTHSLGHLANRWRCTRHEVRKMLAEGRLPFVDILGEIRVPEEAVRWYERDRAETNQAPEESPRAC
jgi:hypothetical protein